MARVELEVPDSREFVIQATIPVPRHTYPRHDGRAPFGVRDVDGTIVGAQVEIVSRYADDLHGADVVEVSARVHRPLTAPPGARLLYDIVFEPHVDGELRVDLAVAAEILNAPGAVRLVARDVFNNTYSLDPLRRNLPNKVMRDGSAIREVRTYGSMMPVTPQSGPAGTLPHFFGVHTYARLFDDMAIVELDLHIDNGHSGIDHTTTSDNPLGGVYFDELELMLPAGWAVRDASPDLFSDGPVQFGQGQRYSIVKQLTAGKMHVFPRQAQMVRRLVLYRPQDEDLAVDFVRDTNLAFARRGVNEQGEELFSWWNEDTARYFPQRHRLPSLAHVSPTQIRADLAARALSLTNALRFGISTGYPVLSGALGWAHPYGVDDGGMAGGDGIVLYDGLRVLEAASNPGWRELTMRHRMLTDRHPVALYDPNGEPSQYENWVINAPNGPWLPIWCFLRPILWAADPFGFLLAPSFQVDAVHQQNRQPPYEAELYSYYPIDFEHFVRYTSPLKSMVWLGNDSLAKDALFLNASLFRMSYNELPNSSYGHVISTGLLIDEQYVAAHPGMGFTFGRLEAWGIDCVAASYSTQSTAWRQHARPWFGRIVDVLEDGQSTCSGIIEAMMYEQLFAGLYRTRQSIEQAIIENMLVSVRESVLAGVDPARTTVLNSILRESCHAMVTAPSWSDEFHAPWNKLAVGDGNFNNPPFCGATPPDGFADGGDSYQCWSSLAYGYEITGNPLYLARASEMAAASGNLLATLQAAGLGNIENRAALLALVQSMQQ